MNQAELAGRVKTWLEARAVDDPLQWHRATEIAAEIWGDEPNSAQLDKLRRVLFRLAAGEAVIEVAQFRPRPGRRLTTPVGAAQPEYSLSVASSGGLMSKAIEYGVRLRV